MGSRQTMIRSRLLHHLKFTAIRDREDGITEAMRNTFDWIFREQAPDAEDITWSPFVQWLKSDQGLYWVAGKPGSGKSTLMKFLYSDRRTKRYLRKWAQSLQLVIAGHFFWNSGTSSQMSIEGLVRTLLHSVGSQLPDLLPALFPDRWADMKSHPYLEFAVLKPWTTAECLQAFRRILSHPFDQYYFFVFIDGLDECSGDHEEMIALLMKMVASPHIKMCVVSRPWNVFRDAFNSSPSLMLQHLTSRDIRVFIRTKFHDHRGFQELQRGNSILATQLVDEIAEKASGVFLWVRLATQSLLRGIANGDRVTDLQRRLQDLPADLEMLFGNILNSVEPPYKVYTARLFQLHRTACEHDNHDTVNLLRFSYAFDEDDALFDERDIPLRKDECVYRLQSMQRLLESSTKGLLETTVWSIDQIPDR